MTLKFSSSSIIKKSPSNSRYFPRLLDGRDKEVKKLYNSNLTIFQIAVKLNVSERVLREKIVTMKLERRAPRFRVKKLDKRKIMELQKLGLSKVAIAKKLKVGLTKLNRAMLEFGLKQPLSGSELEKFKNTILKGKDPTKCGAKMPSRNKTNKLEPFANDIQQLLLDGMTKTAIAKRYSVSTGTIYNLIKICDLHAPFIKKLDPKEDIVKKLFMAGLSHEDIAQKLNCCTQLVDKKIKEMGLKRSQIQIKSPINDNIDLIKKLRNEGCTNRKIAKQLNVHPVWLGKKIKQLDLPPPERKQERNSAMKGHDEELKQMYQSGMLLKDIGEHFGVKYNTVIYRLSKLGIYQPYRNKGVA
ncbi:MAG: hypothetical protein Q4E61_03800 [Alphaproteobacteria bacterium]|nr:hypothetical protein [Alphaproteobacteria bacterium]